MLLALAGENRRSTDGGGGGDGVDTIGTYGGCAADTLGLDLKGWGER